MHARTSGIISLGNKKYSLINAFSNLGHTFGRVSRKTSWHWLIVQNENFAFYSLINYTSNGSKMTHVLFNNQWIRLNKLVDFEFYDGQWCLTSPDVDLKIHIIAEHSAHKCVPAIFPIIDLMHKEYFVRVTGKIRINLTWLDVAELHGTMEEHHGKW
jgi:hypothetical protein